ncbi:hypothetical protein BASA61_003025 [Batrachochytrium salamandrivorans]|nr:hypothetical protein BASA61_003025 [Batrachochytrium salamandrivorans]
MINSRSLDLAVLLGLSRSMAACFVRLLDCRSLGRLLIANKAVRSALLRADRLCISSAVLHVNSPSLWHFLRIFTDAADLWFSEFPGFLLQPTDNTSLHNSGDYHGSFTTYSRSDADLVASSTVLHSLQLISLSYVSSVNDAFLSRLARTCPGLRTLHFQGCRNVSRRALSHLHSFTALRTLSFSIPKVSYLDIRNLIRNCRALNKLYIPKYPFLNNRPEADFRHITVTFLWTLDAAISAVLCDPHMELDWSESLAVTLAVVVDHRDPNKQIASESSIRNTISNINTTSLLSNWIGSQSINQPHQFTDTDKLVALNISRGPNNRLLESIMDGIALQNIQVHQFRHLYLLLMYLGDMRHHKNNANISDILSKPFQVNLSQFSFSNCPSLKSMLLDSKKSPAFGSLNLLQILVLSGARKLVQALLRLGPLLDYRATGSFVPSIKSATALWFSIRANHISIAIDLVDAGAEFSFELVTDFVVNYFMWCESHLELLICMWRKTAGYKQIWSSMNHKGESILHMLAHIKCSDKLEDAILKKGRVLLTLLAVVEFPECTQAVGAKQVTVLRRADKSDSLLVYRFFRDREYLSNPTAIHGHILQTAYALDPSMQVFSAILRAIYIDRKLDSPLSLCDYDLSPNVISRTAHSNMGYATHKERHDYDATTVDLVSVLIMLPKAFVYALNLLSSPGSASVTVCTHDTRKDISLLEYALIVHAPAETIVALIKISSRVPMPCFVDWVHTQLSVLSSTKESSVDVLSSRISCLEALASVIGSLSEVMVKDFEVLISPGWNHSLSEALRLCPVDSPAYMLLCSDKRSLIPRDRSLMLGLENHNIMRELEVALSKSDISVLSRLVADHPDLCSTYTSIGRSLIHQFSLLASVSLRSSIDFVQQFVSLLLNSTEIDTQSVLNRPDAAMYTPLSFSLLVDSVQETTNAVWGMLADPWIAPTQSELPVLALTQYLLDKCVDPVNRFPFDDEMNRHFLFWFLDTVVIDDTHIGKPPLPRDSGRFEVGINVVLGALARWCIWGNLSLNHVDQCGLTVLDLFQLRRGDGDVSEAAHTVIVRALITLGAKSLDDLLGNECDEVDKTLGLVRPAVKETDANITFAKTNVTDTAPPDSGHSLSSNVSLIRNDFAEKPVAARSLSTLSLAQTNMTTSGSQDGIYNKRSHSTSALYIDDTNGKRQKVESLQMVSSTVRQKIVRQPLRMPLSNAQSSDALVHHHSSPQTLALVDIPASKLEGHESDPSLLSLPESNERLHPEPLHMTHKQPRSEGAHHDTRSIIPLNEMSDADRLFSAAAAGDDAKISLLTSSTINLVAVDKFGRMPLHIWCEVVASDPDQHKRLGILDRLIPSTDPIAALNCFDLSLATPLSIAIATSMISKTLLRNVDEEGTPRLSPLAFHMIRRGATLAVRTRTTNETIWHGIARSVFSAQAYTSESVTASHDLSLLTVDGLYLILKVCVRHAHLDLGVVSTVNGLTGLDTLRQRFDRPIDMSISLDEFLRFVSLFKGVSGGGDGLLQPVSTPEVVEMSSGVTDDGDHHPRSYSTQPTGFQRQGYSHHRGGYGREQNYTSSNRGYRGNASRGAYNQRQYNSNDRSSSNYKRNAEDRPYRDGLNRRG